MDRPKGHPTDEDIIEMYWERDENAIRATDRKYGRLIFGLAFGILADKCDSEECRNDTYLAVWNAIPPTRPAILPAFITQIARRIAINRYKAGNAKKRVPSELTVSIDELSETLAGPDRELGAAELGRLIGEYVRSLGERRRYMFVARYYMSRSAAAIASDLGITRSGVHKELAAIRAGLRAHLEKNGVYV